MSNRLPSPLHISKGFRSRDFHSTGLNTIEVMASTLLVGTILVGALRMVGASVRHHESDTRTIQGVCLAEDLLSEILQQHYSEPDDAPRFGVEGSEASQATGPRALWDDVDDYHAWSESPPQLKDGSILPDAAGWRRWVEVKHVAPTALDTALADTDDQGVKRITVRVSYNGQLLATLMAVQTRAWLDMIPDPENDLTTGSKPAVNGPPQAAFTASPMSGAESVTVNLDATVSDDPENDPLTYAWDFGDGATASGAKVSHQFRNNGEHTIVRTVTLTVTDVYGAQSTATRTITIYGDD